MKVFKFGGASVKSASAVKRVAEIILSESEQGNDILIVVSAMGKITNALEQITETYFNSGPDLKEKLSGFIEYHINIIEDLFPDHTNSIYNDFKVLSDALEEKLQKRPSPNFDFEYDQIVPYGELISTLIVSSYINETGTKCKLYDARELVKTDNKYREAKVDWDLTAGKIRLHVFPYFLEKADGEIKIALTQGFIGGAAYGYSTTLGREGSDYTAAIFAYSLKASETVIWKDVPGILNADPRYFENPVKVNHLTYRDAIELAYYGASVIHPDTIRPLENAGIPLHVKSFLSPEDIGTIIDNNSHEGKSEVFFTMKPQQILLSVSPKDFSYMVEKNISQVFEIFDRYKVKVNLTQNSAIGFSVCINDNSRVPALIEALQENYNVRYNKNLNLITIRHYTAEAIENTINGKKALLEQKSRRTYQVVLYA